ncbi:MAG: hypothetical protein M0P13_03245 [Fibrobacteraceae bacterium]|nr:hypothetical protein [Fibrobacteraceae bacterium]
MLISAEGQFINREYSRIRIELFWKHHVQAPDSFDITISGKTSYRYITTPNYRYIEMLPQKIKRQMAIHHLKEYIGISPLKWDDLELLANGDFACKDSSNKNSNRLATALSQTWFSLTFNSPHPDSIQMNGAKGEKRHIRIHTWSSYDGIYLPAVIDIKGQNYSGSLWVRTAKVIHDNAQEKTKTGKKQEKKIFSPLWNGGDGEIKVPLILQMD